MGYGISQWEPFGVWLSEQEKVWAPLLDVEETQDEVVVRAELPGLKKEEIKLQAQGNLLALTGERKGESETKDKTVHLIERASGRFQRVLQLPAEVDGSQARASYEAGVLTIRLPKKEEAKPKEIAIEVK